MKTLRRGLCILMAALLLVAMFAGCGSSDTAEEPEETEKVEATEAPEATPEATPEPEPESYLPLVDETQELSYYYFVAGVNQGVVSDIGSLSFAKAAEELTNVHIEYTLFGSNNDQFGIMVASGDWCDIIDCPYSYTGGLAKALDDDFLMDLTDVVAEYMPHYSAIRDSSDEYYLNTMLDDGRIAAVYGLVSEGTPVEYGTVIRQDWLDELGLDTPVTYDDWYNTLMAFKTEYDCADPLWIPSAGLPLSGYLTAGYGVYGFTSSTMSTAPFYVENDTVKFGAIEDGFKEFLEMYHQWYSDGIFTSDYLNNTNAYVPDYGTISQGNSGIWYSLISLLETPTAMSDDPDFAVAPITDPVINEGDTNHLRFSTDIVQVQNVGLSTTCRDVELAAKWLDFWYSDEGNLLANYGVEGEGYTLVNGEPTLTELVISNPDSLTTDQALLTYARLKGPFVYHWEKLYSTYSTAQQNAIDVWATSDNSYAFPSGATMTSDESTAYNDIMVDILVYVEETMAQFITGEKSLDDWDAYVDQVKSMNIDDCIQYKQSAYDRYINR